MVKRLSTTLSDKKILRGTESFVLLEGVGRHLRETSGQVSCASEEDEFLLSFEVDQLDIFLSHSWHAWWILKYVCLLMYFNGRAAMIIACFVGGLITPCLKSYVRSTSALQDTTLRGLIVSAHSGQARHPAEVQYVSLFVGLTTFYIVLFSWHQIRRILRFSSQSIFLDKVCIHQTNKELKALGIGSIGAILEKCNTMVIAWDRTYFERLWCTFELAAFNLSAASRTVVFLPIEMATVLAVYAVLLQSVEVCRVILVNIQHHISPETPITKIQFDEIYFEIPHTIVIFFFVSCFRNYARDHDILEKQVESFSENDAKCFCCCNNHINPFTGETIPCDRELVNASIAHWYGEDDAELGVKRFNKLIRSRLGRQIDDLSPGLARVPYWWVVQATFLSSFVYLDYLDYSSTRMVYRFCRDGFIDSPAIFGSVMSLAMCFPSALQSDEISQTIAFKVFCFIRERCIDVFIVLLPFLFFQAAYYVEDLLSEALETFPHGELFLNIGESFFYLGLILNFYTSWSITSYVASLRGRTGAHKGSRSEPRWPSMESTSSRASSQSSSSSRTAAPSPQPASTNGRRLSMRSTSNHRRSHECV